MRRPDETPGAGLEDARPLLAIAAWRVGPILALTALGASWAAGWPGAIPPAAAALAAAFAVHREARALGVARGRALSRSAGPDPARAVDAIGRALDARLQRLDALETENAALEAARRQEVLVASLKRRMGAPLLTDRLAVGWLDGRPPADDPSGWVTQGPEVIAWFARPQPSAPAAARLRAEIATLVTALWTHHGEGSAVLAELAGLMTVEVEAFIRLDASSGTAEVARGPLMPIRHDAEGERHPGLTIEPGQALVLSPGPLPPVDVPGTDGARFIFDDYRSAARGRAGLLLVLARPEEPA